MYGILVHFNLLFSACLARAPLNRRASQDSDQPPKGFPLGNPPSWIDDGRTVGDLRLPIPPPLGQDVSGQFLFFTGSAGAFKGGQIFSSILAVALDQWLDNTNAPYLHTAEIRKPPFLDILHTITPALLSQSETLTPLKVGVIYCNMMWSLLREPQWPGHVTASIYKRVPGHGTGSHGLPLGVIYVEKKPKANTFNSARNEPYLIPSSQTLNATVILLKTSNDTNSISEVPNIADREKDWLNIFRQMVFFILKKDPTSRVSDSVTFLGSRGTLFKYYTLGRDSNLMGTMYFTPLAGTLRWQTVGEALLDLCTKVATAAQWKYEEQGIIRADSKVVVRIRFGHDL